MESLPPKNEDSLRGFGFALTAYLLWGFLPIFMKAVGHISPAEVIAHRVIWSIPIAGAVLWATGRTADLWVALRTPRMLLMAMATAALISVNWGIYVWSIGAGHALDAALGYYINPLFSVFLGAVLLGERLSRAQKGAIALAALAVLVLTIEAGKLPLVALGLTVTWGIYAYLKKSLPIGPNQGFFLEVLILLPFALAYVVWAQLAGRSHFMAGVTSDTVLLLSCGLVTAVPLMVYANGAKLLRLSTIGIMQYIAP
ncbi:MAG: EamA family transporter RarD, partial [Cypionkella sp.]